jgi:hypothetical protein
LIDRETAVPRGTLQLDQPAPHAGRERGKPRSQLPAPGAAAASFTARTPRRPRAGEQVVCGETSPEDIHGMHGPGNLTASAA